jgi:signal transduction histidine kinase
MVVVSDNGPGIPVVDHHRIFEPFYTTKPRATGLGLPICRSILDQLGGSLTVISCPEQGAAFSVRLPCRILNSGESLNR